MRIVDFPGWLRGLLVLTLLLFGIEELIFIPWLTAFVASPLFTAWLFKWQTLVAGVLALIGAACTVYTRELSDEFCASLKGILVAGIALALWSSSAIAKPLRAAAVHGDHCPAGRT
jgi:hypothetical protein